MQSLPGKLLQIPKVNLIVKTDGVFSELDAAFFSGQSSIFYCPDLLDNSGIFNEAFYHMVTKPFFRILFSCRDTVDFPKPDIRASSSVQIIS